MDFKGLHIFKTIYDLKSLNKAAKALSYTQSNITAHLKKIEHELRATLFIRGFDGVRPTEKGGTILSIYFADVSAVFTTQTIF